MASSTVSENTDTQSSVRQAGTTPGGRDQPKARLQPDDVVEHRGHAAGACGIGAQRQRHQSGRYRDRRTRTRSARNQIAAHRIVGNAIGRTHADQAGRELVEIGLADDDRAGRAQPRHRSGVVGRRIGKRRAGGGGRQAGDVDIVLDRDGNAVERKLRGIFRAQRLGFRQRLFFIAQADEDGGIVVIANALIAARHGLRRRNGAGAMRGDDRGDGFSHAPPRSERHRVPGGG